MSFQHCSEERLARFEQFGMIARGSLDRDNIGVKRGNPLFHRNNLTAVCSIGGDRSRNSHSSRDQLSDRQSKSSSGDERAASRHHLNFRRDMNPAHRRPVMDKKLTRAKQRTKSGQKSILL